MKKSKIVLVSLFLISFSLYATPPSKSPKTVINNYKTEITQKHKDKIQGVYSIQWKDTRKCNISSSIAYDVNSNIFEARFFQYIYKFGKDWQEEEIDKINTKLNMIKDYLKIKDGGVITGKTKNGRDIINNGKDVWIK